MEIVLPWPQSNGEWLAWCAAVLTILWGVVHLVRPRGDILRSTAGSFHIGIGLAAIFFAQPLIYLALGMAWSFAALTELLALIFTRKNYIHAVLRLLFQAVLAILPILFSIGYVP